MDEPKIIKISDTAITGKKSQGSTCYDDLGVMSTISAGTHGYSMGQILDRKIMKIRRLTPIETERLMTWPDNFTKYGIDENGKTYEMSDTKRYKMTGNGIVSNVSKHFIETILPEGEYSIMSICSGVDGS